MSFIISFEGFRCLHCHCVLMLYFIPRGERMVAGFWGEFGGGVEWEFDLLPI